MLAGAAAVSRRQPGRAGDEDRQRGAAADGASCAPTLPAVAAPRGRALPGQAAAAALPERRASWPTR